MYITYQLHIAVNVSNTLNTLSNELILLFLYYQLLTTSDSLLHGFVKNSFVTLCVWLLLICITQWQLIFCFSVDPTEEFESRPGGFSNKINNNNNVIFNSNNNNNNAVFRSSNKFREEDSFLDQIQSPAMVLIICFVFLVIVIVFKLEDQSRSRFLDASRPSFLNCRDFLHIAKTEF